MKSVMHETASGGFPHPVDKHNSMTDAKDAFEYGLHILNKAIAPDAMSISPQGYPPSTSQTIPQENILRRIQDWIEDPQPSSSILWLYGSGGAGKSVAAQTIVDMCRSGDRLAGTFFFHRKNGADQSWQLVTTLAYQIADNVAGLRSPIDRAMSLHPTLPDQSIDVQFRSLILEPFQQSTSIALRSFIVVIDGLDQCNNEDMQISILSLIEKAVIVSKLPLRFLITSRPETHIREAFEKYPLINSTTQIHFDDSTSIDTSLPSNTHNTGSNPSHPFLERLIPSRKTRRRDLAGAKVSYSSHSFPKLVTLQRSNGNAESYSRSLMMLGHGFPVWYPGGDLGKPIEYLQDGLRIGDVGILDREGIFDFCFNIFLEPDHPIHARSAPREFEPVRPMLDPSEVSFVPNYFKPGEVIASQGVTATKESEGPLNVTITSSEQEGAILILPDGASREDLLSTQRFHEYAKKNAPHWYQVINGYAGVIHTNGSLFLVTGCDKASDWASACFPYHPTDAGSSTPIDLRYTWRPEYAYPWTDDGRARTRFYAPSASKIIPIAEGARNQCVFVRGMRISLSDPSWENTMPRLKSSRLYYTYILQKSPSLDLWINALLVCLRLRISERKAMKKVTSSRLQLFHPNFIIGQVLLGKCPNAEVALVDDAVWCDLTDHGYCTFSEINTLITMVFEHHTIIEKDGIVSLSKNPYPSNGTIDRTRASSPKQSWPALPFLTSFRKSTSEKKSLWVKAIPVGEHAKLF